MLGVILLILLSPLVLWLIYWYFNYYYFERYLKNIPGPKPLPLVGNALALASPISDKWKKNRKIITPAFHFQILEDFIDVFNSASQILIDKLGACSKKETAMGTSVNAQDDLDSEYMRCVNFLLKVLRERFLSPLKTNDFLYRFTKMYREERAALDVVHGYTKSVIARRKREFLSNRKCDEEKVDSFGGRRKRALLDLLLEYSSKDPSFTDTNIREEVDTFMFEGHDTTATSITFALFAIATNREVQNKVYDELKEIFSDNPARRASYKDLQDMKYLETVIKETLRLYTTVPLTGRTVERDVYMNGLLLPKGLMVTIGSHTTMHNAKLYEDPEKFDPERFNADNSVERNPYSYIPFSAGSRNCIGQRFAMLEMKSTISEVLRNFELLPAVPEHKLVLKSEAVLKSANGVFVRLKRRI